MRDVILFLGAVLLGAAAVVGIASVIGCDYPECQDGDTRCANNAAQVCVDGDWLEDDNCDEVPMLDGTIEKWKCCDKEIAFCAEVCE